MNKQNSYAEKIKQLSINSDTSGTLKLEKKLSNLFRPVQNHTGDKQLNLQAFDQVISIDVKNLTAEVEGLTTYEDFVSETIKYGCLPTVVPELKSITVGGALAGCGIESSSFRYGLVHETVKEFDVLLSDGKIVTCTPTNEHRDLFYAFPNTFGTLGYALRVKVGLIPIQNFVKLTHERFNEPVEFFNAMENYCENGDNLNFIEGVIFSKKEMYITRGRFVEDALDVSDYTNKNIYFRSIRDKSEDYLTAHDYIWRWDTDWFWCSEVFLMQHSVIRNLLGKYMLGSKKFTKVMNFFNRRPLLKLFWNKICGRQESIIQDISIPIHQALNFYHFFENQIGIHPIWICPTKGGSEEKAFDFCPMEKSTLYLDFGFWNSVPTDKSDGYYNRLIEDVTRQLGGFKSMYSSSYYTEDEFWEIYDKSKYTILKEKYDPKGRLKGLFEKCCSL